MLYIKQEGFKIIPTKKVIKAEEYSEYLQAKGIIEKAKQESKRIIQEAKNAFEEEKKRGFEEGLEEGKKQTAEHMMEYVSKTVAGYGKFEEKILEILMQALRHILGEMDNKTLVMSVVKRVIATVRTQKEITLRVAPSQKDYVQEQIAPILQQYPSISFIDVVPDQRLKEGDAIAETDIGVVDARLDVQLDAIQKAFTKLIK